MEHTSEKYFEKTLKKKVTDLGGECLKWVSPGTNGVPDRLIFMPNEKLYIAEIKTTGKTLEPLQKYWMRRLVSLGFKHYIVDSDESLNKLLNDIQAV